MAMFNRIAVAALATTMAISSPALAATTISFATLTWNGNIATASNAGISVQASAYSYNSALSNATLGSYGSNGFGVTNSSETGANNTHTADNQSGDDLIVLVFNQAVNIASAVVTPFTLNSQTDADLFVSYATVSGAFNGSTPTALALNNAVWAGAFATNGKNVSAQVAAVNNVSQTSNLNTTGLYGNVWVIGAARSSFAAKGGFDNTIDGVKLGSISVNVAPVPEPATWAMMVGGFGIAGAALRRRRRTAVAQVLA